MTKTTGNFYIPLSGSRTMPIDEFDTSIHLRHAADQAKARGFDRFPIIDVDSHHYETESFSEILEFLEDPVLQQLAKTASASRHGAFGMLPGNIGYQDMGGRVARYPLRHLEKTGPEAHRDITMAKRWMDALSVDIAILFPTPMLNLGLHPQIEIEVALSRAYNRWLTEKILPNDPRLRSMLYLPFNDPQATYEMAKEFAGKPGVLGYMVTATRNRAVHNDAYMKTYAFLEEAGLPLGFHASYNWNDQTMAMMNKFLSVHALGFAISNMVHLTNWVINALPVRFPKLKVIWIESGLAWIPFLMQRLDHEYYMRKSEVPSLTKPPSDYMREMFYTSQPMERPKDMRELEQTFRMINAPTQLMYSSDYPHWDFDVPSVIYDLPFLSEEEKRAILGGNAARVFNIDIKEKLAKSF
jgi:predicted TIM-barrel fold metal-dependent hydrolase